MPVIDRNRLKQYLDLDLNVLFIGLHGVGKTAVVKEVLTERFGDRWKYASCSTLDPWVDLVGVPKAIDDPNGGQVLELIPPKFIKHDEIEALVLDEFNRAPDKVINAVMEIIQFKSINGRKLPSLKVVWAMINPEDDDDTYSVNHLDPAQLDRFQVHYQVPYMIDEDYFTAKYPATAPIFISWWKDLPGEIQRKVSPRRVDYVASAHANGCRLEDFLPKESNVRALRQLLKSLPFHDAIKKITDETAATTFVKDVNNTTKLLDLVKANDAAAVDFFTKYGKVLPKELVEPFAEFVYARSQGFEVVKSLEELLEKLPSDRGGQGTAALINNVSLELLYKNGGNLKNDLLALSKSKPNLVTKLTNRVTDIFLTCQAKTLSRIIWGLEDPTAGQQSNKHTNFYLIAKCLSELKRFTKAEARTINNKLYGRQIVKEMNFL